MESILPSIISACILFIITRLLGKKQISQLTFFDYMIGITIGNIAATVSIDPQISFQSGIVSMIIWALFPFLFYYISKKSFFGRRLLDGIPTILIQNGKIVEKNLNKTKFTINDLLEEMRLKDVFNLEDVEYAILETNGKISVLKKSGKQTVTASQMNIITEYQGLNAIIILDGHFMDTNLSLLNLEKTWVYDQLKKYNIDSVKEVLVATYVNGTLHIDRKNSDPKILSVLS